jgi:broad specificity phosphatase PhoE
MSQTIWIARHGNRLDFVRPEWFDTALRRYDPPLSKDGFVQAKQLAQRLKGENIRHIFASPFFVNGANCPCRRRSFRFTLETRMGNL